MELLLRSPIVVRVLCAVVTGCVVYVAVTNFRKSMGLCCSSPEDIIGEEEKKKDIQEAGAGEKSTKKKSIVQSNRFVVNDRKKKSKSVHISPRSRKSSAVRKAERSRKVKSVRHNANKFVTRDRKSTPASPTNIHQCMQSDCTNMVDNLYGGGIKLRCTERKNALARLNLYFCSKAHAPECAMCDGTMGAANVYVNNILDLKKLAKKRNPKWNSLKVYCSEKCFDKVHRNSASVVKGAENICGAAKLELLHTEFENDFEETMRKIAPVLAATLSVPTCKFCRCPFLAQDKIVTCGAVKSHWDCAARGSAVYSKTRKKPKMAPMTPRVIAGFYLHQIEKDIEKCKKLLPHKDPLRYAQTNHQYAFEAICRGKKSLLYLFVDLKDARRAVDGAEGMDPIDLTFVPVGKAVVTAKKSMTLNDFTKGLQVRHHIVGEGLEFLQDTESKEHASLVKGDSKGGINIEVTLHRASAGVEQIFHLRLSYAPKTGRLKILPSVLSNVPVSTLLA